MVGFTEYIALPAGSRSCLHSSTPLPASEAGNLIDVKACHLPRYSYGDSATSQSKVAVLPEFKEVIEDKSLGDTFTANLNAGSEISGLRYEWNLGDDSVKNGASISHTYSKIDTYVVKLKVYDTTIQEPEATPQRVWHPPLLLGQSVIRPQLGSEELALEEETWVTIWRKAPKAKFKYTTNGGENIPVAKLSSNRSRNGEKVLQISRQ
jgi:hypothetical protein